MLSFLFTCAVVSIGCGSLLCFFGRRTRDFLFDCFKCACCCSFDLRSRNERGNRLLMAVPFPHIFITSRFRSTPALGVCYPKCDDFWSVLCKDRSPPKLSVSAHFRHVSVSKWRAVDFDDFEAFIDRARGIFVRSTAQNCFPLPSVFVTSWFRSIPMLMSRCFWIEPKASLYRV